MLNPKKILVVEDDNELCDVLKYLFDIEGFIYDIRHDGTNITKVVEKFKPDLMLFDYALPTKNGLKLCLEVKDNKAQRDLPVILCTAMPRAAIEDDDCYDSFIEKPFDLDELINEIYRLLLLKPKSN